jgi:multiple sugar transport system ATP-binding protein
MRGGIIQQLADPKTIYNKPSNLFVAGFLGSPAMTFLSGELVDQPEGKSFRMDGVTVPLAGYDGDVPASTGRPVTLGVRPEHIAIHRDGEGEGIPATMELDEPMGSDSLLWLTAAGRQISVRTTADHGFSHGQPVKLAFDISKASLFDQGTEQRL